MAKLPVAQLPDIVPPQINVSATYTGADALTIEQSVATPLEQQMNGVDNMLYMMSTNANDGTMTLKVTFDVGTNVDIDQVNTQNRVSQASPNLPTSVNQYGVTVKKLMGLPLLVISLYSPKGTYGGQFLGNYATINLNDALLRVPGVGQVTNFGAARLCDARLGQAGPANQARHDRLRSDHGRPATERGEPGGSNRCGAGPARASNSPTPSALRDDSSTPKNSATSSSARTLTVRPCD